MLLGSNSNLNDQLTSHYQVPKAGGQGTHWEAILFSLRKEKGAAERGKGKERNGREWEEEGKERTGMGWDTETPPFDSIDFLWTDNHL